MDASLLVSSISEGVKRLARAGRMTCKVRRDFKIITDELLRVSRQFHWWHRTFGDLRFVPQNLYIRKQIRRFRRVEGSCQNGCVKGSEAPTRPTPVCFNLSVRRMSTVSSHQHRWQKWTFRVATIIAQWTINDCYIFFPYRRVWYFFFCGLLSLQHNTLVLCYTRSVYIDWKLVNFTNGCTENQDTLLVHITIVYANFALRLCWTQEYSVDEGFASRTSVGFGNSI